MAITSREELEEWLKDKPTEWAQVIAARAALRALPYAFARNVGYNWDAVLSLSLIRASAISWGYSNFPTYTMATAANDAIFAAQAANAAVNASHGSNSANITNAAAYAVNSAANAAIAAHASNATNAANAAARAANAASYAARAADAPFPAISIIWANINHDCDQLASDSYLSSAARRLTHEPLWPHSEPADCYDTWAYATARLSALNISYGVWIDWYNRRIEGHDAAFDIPGDYDRSEDNAILACLADATNADFWGKGATYVNTTLQSWIDEARERAAANIVDAEPEPQNSDVISFRRIDSGQFDPDFETGVGELLTDQAACDRHLAFVTTAGEALSLCGGHNQISHVADHLKIVIEAAGDHPVHMRVDLLIARGERMIDDLKDAVDELQPDPEVALDNLREKRIVNVLRALIRDYMAMTKLDPALDRRQRLPHEEENAASLVSPQQAMIFVNSSVTIGVITQAARDIVVEGANGLPEHGDPKDRRQWRFSEMVRNLPRSMIGFLWQYRTAIVGSTVAGVTGVAMALITQEAAIRAFFATNPGMLRVIDELVNIIRNVGM